MQQQPPDPLPILSDARPQPTRPRGSRLEYVLLLVAALSVLVIAWYAGWGRREPPPVALAPPPQAAPASAPSPAPSVPSVRYPMAQPASPTSLPALDESDVELTRRLEEAIGRQAVAQLRTSGLVRQVVATVDNLSRSHAPSRLWPVEPTGGRFQVTGIDGHVAISGTNELRYAPFVSLAETVDVQRLAALYRATYPLFQQAYEELGFPGKPFNDRLIDTIDHLLAAPEPQGPVEVELVRVEGPTPLTRPWVHYTFADPKLEALSAGQKIMVRVGRANELRLKVQLKRLRAALLQAAAPGAQ